MKTRCVSIIKYFSKPPYFEKTKQIVNKKGEVVEVEERRANDFPTYAGFAAKIGVTRQVLHDWCDKHPEFLYAYNKCKSLQEKFLVTNGLNGMFNSGFAIFTAKNVIGWRDKQQDEQQQDTNALALALLELNKKEKS